jgi:hypothetical protein
LKRTDPGLAEQDAHAEGGPDLLPAPGQPSSLEELKRAYSEAAARLAELEVSVANLEAELGSFRVGFTTTCGDLAMDLADLELQVAQILLERRPEDPVLRQRVTEAEANARRYEDAVTRWTDEDRDAATANGPPSPEARTVFREIARGVHPDLALI